MLFCLTVLQVSLMEHNPDHFEDWQLIQITNFMSIWSILNKITNGRIKIVVHKVQKLEQTPKLSDI